jgi:hypothetical protein
MRGSLVYRCYDIPQHEVIHTLVPEARAWRIGGPSEHFIDDPLSTPQGAPTGKIRGDGYAKPRVYLAPPL